MDYDKTGIPAVYDRARSRSPEVLSLWMDEVAAGLLGRQPVATILDLGCGTGRFAAPLGERFGSLVIGMDPSSKMLRQALAKPKAGSIRYVAAHGENMPMRDGSVDLVFMSMVFHHFVDPMRVARECHRVLGPTGLVFLRAGTAERIPSYPITPYFPSAVPIMERVLAPAASIRRSFESAGFSATAIGALEQEIAPAHAVFADQIEVGGDSVLVQLEKAQLEAGLTELRSHALHADPAPVRELIDFFWFEKVS